MRLKFLHLQTGSFRTLTTICRCQSLNKPGCQLIKPENAADRTACRPAQSWNLYALKTLCLTRRCVQVKNWQLLQGNGSALGKNVCYQRGEIFFPFGKFSCVAVTENYKLNIEHIKKLRNIPSRFYSVISAGKIIPKHGNQTVKRPPKAPRTKQPSRTNQPLLSDMEVKWNLQKMNQFNLDLDFYEISIIYLMSRISLFTVGTLQTNKLHRNWCDWSFEDKMES